MADDDGYQPGAVSDYAVFVHLPFRACNGNGHADGRIGAFLFADHCPVPLLPEAHHFRNQNLRIEIAFQCEKVEVAHDYRENRRIRVEISEHNGTIQAVRDRLKGIDYIADSGRGRTDPFRLETDAGVSSSFQKFEWSWERAASGKIKFDYAGTRRKT